MPRLPEFGRALIGLATCRPTDNGPKNPQNRNKHRLFGKEYLLDFQLPQQGGNKNQAQLKAFRRVVVTQPFAPQLQYEFAESDHETFGIGPPFQSLAKSL